MTFASPPNISRRWREGGRLISGKPVVLCEATKRPVLLAGRAAGRTGPAETLVPSDGTSALDRLADPGLAPPEIKRVKRLAGSSLSTLEEALSGAAVNAPGALGTAAGWIVCSGIPSGNVCPRPVVGFRTVAGTVKTGFSSTGPIPFRMYKFPFPGCACTSTAFKSSSGVLNSVRRTVSKEKFLSPSSVASHPVGRSGHSTSKSPACKSTCEKNNGAA